MQWSQESARHTATRKRACERRVVVMSSKHGSSSAKACWARPATSLPGWRGSEKDAWLRSSRCCCMYATSCSVCIGVSPLPRSKRLPRSPRVQKQTPTALPSSCRCWRGQYWVLVKGADGRLAWWGCGSGARMAGLTPARCVVMLLGAAAKAGRGYCEQAEAGGGAGLCCRVLSCSPCCCCCCCCCCWLSFAMVCVSLTMSS